jgi:hypothetical protein
MALKGMGLPPSTHRHSGLSIFVLPLNESLKGFPRFRLGFQRVTQLEGSLVLLRAFYLEPLFGSKKWSLLVQALSSKIVLNPLRLS